MLQVSRISATDSQSFCFWLNSSTRDNAQRARTPSDRVATSAGAGEPKGPGQIGGSPARAAPSAEQHAPVSPTPDPTRPSHVAVCSSRGRSHCHRAKHGVLPGTALANFCGDYICKKKTGLLSSVSERFRIALLSQNDGFQT